jgi:hypothetical protein
MSSSDFRRYGQRGQGRWITVYARNGHTFAVIAGLRLDTTPGDSSRYRWAPRWQTTFCGPAGFEALHPAGFIDGTNAQRPTPNAQRAMAEV